MAKESAGLVMFRLRGGRPEVLLVHPGGPFWRNRDDRAWTIPKGEVAPGEDRFEAAKREFGEELGVTPGGEFVKLSPAKQRGGKLVHAWAFEGDLDPSACRSNTFTIEWPPRSGRQAEFPEIDRAEFFDLAAAKRKINPAQAAFLTEVEALVSRRRA